MFWMFGPLVPVQELNFSLTMRTFLFLAPVNFFDVAVKTTLLCGFKAAFSAGIEYIPVLGIHMQSPCMSVIKLQVTKFALIVLFLSFPFIVSFVFV